MLGRGCVVWCVNIVLRAQNLFPLWYNSYTILVSVFVGCLHRIEPGPPVHHHMIWILFLLFPLFYSMPSAQEAFNNFERMLDKQFKEIDEQFEEMLTRCTVPEDFIHVRSPRERELRRE